MNRKSSKKSKPCTTRSRTGRGQAKHPSISLVANIFLLYCLDHFDHFNDSFYYPRKYVEFYRLDDDGLEYFDQKDDTSSSQRPSSSAPAEQKDAEDDNALHGHVYSNSSTDCYFGPFTPPIHTGLDEFELTSYCGKYKIVFQFPTNEHL